MGWHTAVVKQLESGPVEQLFQAASNSDFAVAALLPDPLSTGVVQSLVGAECAATGYAGIEWALASAAASGSPHPRHVTVRCRIPDRAGAGRGLGRTDPASVESAQAQLLCRTGRADGIGHVRGPLKAASTDD